ncbi:exopolysaccharide transport family protein [Mesorhizobium sp. YC-39]|uniref:GumC family protein n=1 Tax=unclassified Mesorhizobium TaxID=325217 RepID=UPI0021E84B23|nr:MULTISPECIES: exopolysaccharide transport family protein [unclassified Mesorhizobium]MCV3208337.1 exopolysaccharide transport family protein [Mesorhizobium sp. YC-2]MCV3232313.1 exopolysaccharide transport family protein [Mesorhizobium sp. YC-39]
MEGSIVSRIQLPRATEMHVSARETKPRMRRPLREQIDTENPLHQLLTTIARRKWFLLGMVVLGGVLAGLAGLARSVEFEATTQIILDAPGRVGPNGTDAGMLDATIDDNITTLTSQGHLRRVAAALRKMEASGTAAQSDSGTGDSRPNPVGDGQSNSRSFAGGLFSRIWPQSKPEDLDAAELKALRKDLRVGQELRSRVITVGFTDNDPTRAAMVANTFAQLYIDDLATRHQASDKLELASIVAALPGVQSDLAEATDRLEKYRLSHGAVDQGAADSAARETADLSQQISLSRADLSASEARLQHIQDLQKQGASVTALAEAMGSQVLADLAVRQASGTANEDLTNAINLEIERGTARIAAEAEIYRTQITTLETRKNVLDAVAADTAGRLSGLRALEPQVSILTQRYNQLLTQQQELKQRIASPSAGVSVLSAAWPPTNPRTLSPIFLIPPGMVVFGLIGGAFVVLRNRLDQTLRGVAEAEAALGIPCLGLIPQAPTMHAKRLQQLVLAQQKSRYSRAITSLLVAAAPKPARDRSSHVILVTSSVQDDGKTELAWSLALAATRLGGKVLFLDLDSTGVRLTNEFLDEFTAHKPHNFFGDYVNDRCALHDATVGMPEIGIDFMALAPSEDLLALLSTADSSLFTDELQSIYNVVIINGPLGLAGPEAGLLTGWADAVLFAIRWGKTRRSIARGVLEPLASDASTSIPVGSVLTQVDLKKHAGYHFGDSADLLLERAS